jgi:hypothetical protein
MPRKVWMDGFGMITEQQAADIRRRHEAHRSAADALPGRKGGWRSWNPKDPNLPEAIRRGPTNEEVSELEVFDFERNRPPSLFAYYDKSMTKVTTWTGQKLGDIVWKGTVYRTGWWPGARKQRVRVRAITGDTYAGPCEMDAGTYCRLRKVRGR